VILIGATLTLLRWLRGLLNGLEKHNPRPRFLLHQIEPPLRIAIWFAALLISAEILAPSRDAFLATPVRRLWQIGLGLQELIKNLIDGMVVIVDRPYQIGDKRPWNACLDQSVCVRPSLCFSNENRPST